MIRVRAYPRSYSRPWLLGGFVVLGGAALAIAATGRVATGLTALAAVFVVAGFRSVSVRMAGVIAGDVVLLHRNGLAGAKAIYLVGVLAVIVAALPAARRVFADREWRAERRLLAASAAFAVIVPISLVVGHLRGVGLVDSTRDASVYLLLAAVPLLALDLRTAVGLRWCRWALLTVGLVCWLSFLVVWVQLRGYLTLPFSQMLLPSLYLPAALLAYATALGLRRPRAWRWWALAAVVAVGIAFTGSRTFLLLLLAPIVQLALRRERRKWLWAVACVGALVFTLGILLARVGPSSGPVARLASATTFITHPRRDPSWQERARETSGALRTWRHEPVLGAGAGHLFHWRNFSGQARSSFLIDSSASYLAKFGLLGLVLGLVFVAAFVPPLRSRLRRPDVGAGAEALIGFAAVAAGGLFLGVPMEDKGFPIGVLLLFALAQPGAAEPDTPEPALRRRALVLAAVAACACAVSAVAAISPGANVHGSAAGPTYPESRPGAPVVQAFERALMAGDGGTACRLLGVVRRAEMPNCEGRLSQLAAGSREFDASILVRDRSELAGRIRYIVVRRPSAALGHYLLVRENGGWRIGDAWPLGTVGVKDHWRAPLIVGARDAAATAVQSVSRLLWRRQTAAACHALAPALANRLGMRCAALLRNQIGYGREVYGAFVVSERSAGRGLERVIVSRVGGLRTEYTVELQGASPRIDAIVPAS